MAFIENWMFKPLPPKRNKNDLLLEQKVVEEVVLNSKTMEEIKKEESITTESPKTQKITAKEKLISVFLYLLMTAFVVFLLAYLVMSFNNHPNIERVGEYLKLFLTTLIGFFIGTNKERE